MHISLARRLKENRHIVDLSSTMAHMLTWVRYGHYDFFSDINIEINTNCNRRCTYCPNSISDRGMSKNSRHMDPAIYNKLIDELAQINYRGRISPHLFGEPLLHPELAKLITYTRTKLPKATLMIFTNGDLLSIDKFNELLSLGIDKFVISEHDRSLSRQLKSLYSYVDDLPEKKRKIKRYNIVPETRLSNRGGLVSPSQLNTIPRCAFHHNPVAIDYNGNVILCCNDFFSTMKFGNIRNERFLDIWFDKRFQKIRKELRKKRYKLPICQKCVDV